MAKFLSFLLSVTVINSYYLLAEAYPCSYWPALPGFTGFRMATVQQQLTREKTERVFFYFIFLPFLLLFFWSARNSWSTFGRRGPCGEHNRSITARYRLLSRFDIRWATRFDGAPILFVFFFNCCVFFSIDRNLVSSQMGRRVYFFVANGEKSDRREKSCH